MDGESNIVGSAEIEIVANVSANTDGLIEQIAAEAQSALDGLDLSVLGERMASLEKKIGTGATNPSSGAAGAATATGGATQPLENVAIGSVAGIVEAIEAAISKATFKLTIDAASVVSQIQTALAGAEFTVSLKAAGLSVAAADDDGKPSRPAPAVQPEAAKPQTGAEEAARQAAAAAANAARAYSEPPALTAALKSKIGSDIKGATESLYVMLKGTLEDAGKVWGSVPETGVSGAPIHQLLGEIVALVGKSDEWGSPGQKHTAAPVASKLAELGVKDPDIQTIVDTLSNLPKHLQGIGEITKQLASQAPAPAAPTPVAAPAQAPAPAAAPASQSGVSAGLRGIDDAAKAAAEEANRKAQREATDQAVRNLADAAKANVVKPEDAPRYAGQVWRGSVQKLVEKVSKIDVGAGPLATGERPVGMATSEETVRATDEATIAARVDAQERAQIAVTKRLQDRKVAIRRELGRMMTADFEEKQGRKPARGELGKASEYFSDSTGDITNPAAEKLIDELKRINSALTKPNTRLDAVESGEYTRSLPALPDVESGLVSDHPVFVTSPGMGADPARKRLPYLVDRFMTRTKAGDVRTREVGRHGGGGREHGTALGAAYDALTSGVIASHGGPFDLDPATGKFLTREEILERSQGVLPTPASPSDPTFSYGDLLRRAQLGAFSDQAEIYNENREPTGELFRYDPTDAENPEVAKILRGDYGKIAPDDGKARFAKRLSPQEVAKRAILEANAAGGARGQGMVPRKDLAVPPGGTIDESFAMRVVSKLLPSAARSFSLPDMMVKLGGEAGKRSGLHTGAERPLQALIEADFKLVNLYKGLVELGNEIEPLISFKNAYERMIDEGRGGPDAQAEYADIISELKTAKGNFDRKLKQMRKLVKEEGADPAALVHAGLAPADTKDAIRRQRIGYQGSSTKAVEERVGVGEETLRKERLTGGAGRVTNPKTLEMEGGDAVIKGAVGSETARNAAYSINAQHQLEEMARLMQEGKFDYSESNLPEGRALRSAAFTDPKTGEKSMRKEGATRYAIARQHIIGILDNFRAQIAKDRGIPTHEVPGWGTEDIPSGFGQILGAYKQAVYAAAVESRGTGELSFAEQDRRAAEGRAYRDTGSGLLPGAAPKSQYHGGSAGRAEERASAALIASRRPVVTPLDQKRVEAQRLLTSIKSQDSETNDPMARAARQKVAELERTARSAMRSDRERPVGAQRRGHIVDGEPVWDQASIHTEQLNPRDDQFFFGEGRTPGSSLYLQSATGTSSGQMERGRGSAFLPLMYPELAEAQRIKATEKARVSKARRDLDRIRIAQKAAHDLVYLAGGAGVVDWESRPATRRESREGYRVPGQEEPSKVEEGQQIWDVPVVGRSVTRGGDEALAALESMKPEDVPDHYIREMYNGRRISEGQDRLSRQQIIDEAIAQMKSGTAVGYRQEDVERRKVGQRQDRLLELERSSGQVQRKIDAIETLGNPAWAADLMVQWKSTLEANQKEAADLEAGKSDPYSGDKNREVTARTVAIAGAEKAAGSRAAGGAGGGGGSRTTSGAGGAGEHGGGSGGAMRPGTQRVLVVNPQPIPVAIFGASGSAGYGRGFVANSVADFNYQKALQSIKDAAVPTQAGEGVPNGQMGMFGPPKRERKAGRAYRIYEKLSDEGLSTDDIYDRMSSMGFRDAAGIILGRQGHFDRARAEGGGSGGAGAGEDALRRRFGLPAVPPTGPEYYAEIDKGDVARSEMSARARRAQRGIPSRGFMASMTDMFSNLGGFLDDQIAAVSRYQTEGNELATMMKRTPALAKRVASQEETKSAMEGTLEELKATRAGLAEPGAAQELGLTDKEAKKALKGLDTAIVEVSNSITKQTDRISKARRDLDENKTAVADQNNRVMAAEGGLPGPTSRLAAFGIGAAASSVSIGIGMMLAQVGQQMAGLLIQGVSAAIGPAFERAIGDPSVTARFVGQAGQVSGQARGIRQLEEATWASQLNLTAKQGSLIGGPIIDQGEIEEGNKRLAETGGALRAFQRLQSTGVGGTFTGTSGFLGSWINQIPSTSQIVGSIARDFNKFQKPSPMMDVGGGADTIGPMSGYNPEITPGQLETMLREGTLPKAGQDIRMVETPDFERLNKQFTDNVEYTNTALGVLNDGLVRGGEKAAKFTATFEGLDEKKLKEQENLVRAAGAPELADAIAAKQVALVKKDASGKDQPITDIEAIAKALTAESTGFLKPDLQGLIDLNKNQMTAQFQLQDAMGQMARGTGAFEGMGVIESKLGISLAAQPIGSPTSGITGTALRKGESANVPGGMKELKSQYAEINQMQRDGVAAANEFVSKWLVGSDAVGEFASSLKLVESYGKQISEIQIGREVAHAAYTADQFGYSIYIASRSLKDAENYASALAGKGGGGLGGIQGASVRLQREAQGLQLGMSQLQINFQKSLAGFTAPGDTPEERSARIHQAKIEADYAQKQLDIQEKLFKLSGRALTISADRSVKDLTKQLGLLEEGRQISLDDAAAQKKIRALNVLMGKETAIVNQIFDEAQSRANDLLSLSGKFAAEVGEDVGKVFKTIYSNYVLWVRSFNAALSGSWRGQTGSNDNDASSIAKREREQKKDLNGNGVIGAASGFLGNVSQPTDFTVGEVANETVAVLRNPRSMMTPMGGGGTYNVTINVTGNHVRSDKDLDELAYKIERAMNQKAALMGYRKPI